jgi:hypothetical protein
MEKESHIPTQTVLETQLQVSGWLNTLQILDHAATVIDHTHFVLFCFDYIGILSFQLGTIGNFGGKSVFMAFRISIIWGYEGYYLLGYNEGVVLWNSTDVSEKHVAFTLNFYGKRCIIFHKIERSVVSVLFNVKH